MVAPTTPLAIKFTGAPPIKSGAPLVLACTVNPGRLPAASAKIAYGAGLNHWRGVRVKKASAPWVLTAICSQLLVPAKISPKSTAVVNNPLDTPTAELVTGPAMATPVALVAYSVNVRS